MLKTVGETLDKALEKLDIDRENDVVYVSHQAGTPAISSAVQFLTIGQFKQVQFLVSNPVYDDESDAIKGKAQLIRSSSYSRGIKISQAKRFLQKGEPGVALEILSDINYFAEKNNKDIEKQLNKLVNRFNIKDSQPDLDEFNPAKAIERVVDALDLIEIFFENENYALGVALLAAAHETFLKAAILERVSRLPSQTINGIKIQPTILIQWDNSGLFFKSKNGLGNEIVNVFSKIEVSSLLQFPVPEYCDRDRHKPNSSNDYQSFWGSYINNTKYFSLNNCRMFKWLNQLGKFNGWKLLEWTCTYKRDREQDKRNQLMHNLRGVTKLDVIQYLKNPDGNDANPDENVAEVYRRFVKQPFRDALLDLELWVTIRSKIN